MNKFKIFFFFLFIITFFLIDFLLQVLNPSPYKVDPILGWSTKKNFQHVYNQTDYYGDKYKSKYLTNEYGARHYRTNIKSSNSKEIYRILILGDSFTMDQYSGNDKMWFSELSENLSRMLLKNVEVNAFGAGGYGNLQEYLVLKNQPQFLTKYNPNILILQFCANDFSNNNLEIEKKGFYISQFMRRPYLIENNITFYQNWITYFYRDNFYLRDSRIFAKFTFYLEFFLRNFLIKKEHKIDENLINQSKQTTFDLLVKIKNLYPDIPAFIFSCSNEPEYWEEIARKSNFLILNNSSNLVKNAKKNNLKIFYKDGAHLNDLGNNLLGKQIFFDLKLSEKLY